VTKSFLLTPERSYERKIKEALLAYQIDRAFSKDDILYLYLNQIYLGHGAYGVEAAAQNYFDKSVAELNLAESALLAGLPQAPSRYSPFYYMDRAKQRQIYVLNRMVDEGHITQIEASEAISYELDIRPRRNLYLENVPVYSEHVRRYIERKYGEEALYTQGLKVYTAVNLNMQRAAMEQITKGLKELDRREGYRGPLNRVTEDEIDAFSEALQLELEKAPLGPGVTARGVVVAVNDNAGKVTVRMGEHKGEILLENMRWARKPDPDVAWHAAQIRRPSQALTVGDVVLVEVLEQADKSGLWKLGLDQSPVVQAALVTIEAGTGMVKAMVGGGIFPRASSTAPFNRVGNPDRHSSPSFTPLPWNGVIHRPASLSIHRSFSRIANRILPGSRETMVRSFMDPLCFAKRWRSRATW
jgi:penicillin-binding protein 1A